MNLQIADGTRLEDANADERQQTINLFARVSGIGPVAARKFYDDGVRTLEQLGQQKLNTHQQIGLKYFKEFEERIPRAEMAKMEVFPTYNLATCE